MNRVWFGSLVLGLSLAAASVSPLALARVKHEGAWPKADKNVSLDLDHVPRAQAVRKLAEAAGWSLVIHAPQGDTIDIHVKDQPASKVLDVLLSDRDYVATMEGTLLSIDLGGSDAATGAAVAAPSPPTPPTPPTPPALPSLPGLPPLPAPPGAHMDDDADHAEEAADRAAEARDRATEALDKGKRGEDRTVAGGNLRIDKDDVVHDVTVFGGNVDVYGTVTGDISVMGGNVHMRDTSHVKGDASALGGSLVLDDGATIDGDVSVMGGRLQRGGKCHIGGTVVTKGGSDSGRGDHSDGIHIGGREKLRGFVSNVGGALTRAAMLFVFGAVLLALAGKRMESMRVEAAARPMRSFAMGIVGLLGALVVVIALCVTVVGIPVAIIGLLLGVFGAYAGVCAVLSVAGEAVLKHKTKNQYVHLAVGCAMFLALGVIPWIGDLLTVAVAFVGIGVLVATRAAGFVKPKGPKVDEGPYRTVADA